MPDLNIERLQLEINDAPGHEHRIAGIAQRATALLAEQIDIRYGGGRGWFPKKVDSVHAGPVEVDLNRIGDEQAARSIADAWLQALALRLKA
jgi:hypothetical protein